MKLRGLLVAAALLTMSRGVCGQSVTFAPAQTPAVREWRPAQANNAQGPAVPEPKITVADTKIEETAALQRRANIRYLASVDSTHFPEVEDALLNALRSDRNESVRLEAALALSKGCTYSKKTVAALLLAANGETSDGHPAESSARVRTVATLATGSVLVSGRLSNHPGNPSTGVGKPGPAVQHAAAFSPTPAGGMPLICDQASRYLAATISTSPQTRTLVPGMRGPATTETGASPGQPQKVDDNRASENTVRGLIGSENRRHPGLLTALSIIQSTSADAQHIWRRHYAARAITRQSDPINQFSLRTSSHQVPARYAGQP